MGTPASPANGSPKPDPVELNFWGIKVRVPVPRPALYGIAIALILGASVFFLSKYFVVLQKQVWTNVSNDAIAYAQLLPNTELAEYPKHWAEKPKWTFPSAETAPANLQQQLVPPGVKLEYFESDGCLLVTRETPGRPPTTHWVLDLSRVQIPAPPAQTGPPKAAKLMGTAPPVMLADLGAAPMPSRSTSEDRGLDRTRMPDWQADDGGSSKFSIADKLGIELKPVQGGGHCINPHPGPFNQWYGQVNGCFVQVWRQWPDGCTHFQWFNRCYNYFDPNITWTNCVH